MGSILKLVSVAAIVFSFAGLSYAQDLGSSNKLFGGSKKTVAAPPSPKPVGAKPKPHPKRSAAVKKTSPKVTSEKTTAKKTPATEEKSTVKKDVAKNTAPKKTTVIKKPVEKPVASGSTVDGRFSSFKSTKPLTDSSKRLYEQLVDEGNRSRNNRDYFAAETAYQKARALNSKDPRAIYALGTIYSDQQRWEDAEAAYRAALKLDPKDVVATIALSYVLTQPLVVDNLSDRYAEAETLARHATEMAQSNALAYDQLGVALELRGLTGTETEYAYRKAIQLDRYCAPAHAHLGRLLRRRGQTQGASDAYKTAVDNAKDASALIVVAESLQSEQKFSDSEPLLRKALDDDPRNAAALLLLGRALTVGGDFPDAEIMLRRALDVSPNGFLPNTLLASLYLRQLKHGQAETALLAAERRVPDGSRLQLARQFEELGDAYFHGGKLANAERSYREAQRLDEKNVAIKDKIARVHGG